VEQEDYERLVGLFERLRTSAVPVVVEGKKDKAALEALGLQRVIALDRRPLYAVAEEVMALGTACIVLTDLDAEGRKLYARLAHDLRDHGVDIDDTLRNFLSRNTELRQIEGLPRYLERWRREHLGRHRDTGRAQRARKPQAL
jgi:5S rRNA maturation endonuclease (ribonuclease M5)